MAWFYLALKFIHILSAIVAVGSNITYGVWSARSSGDAARMSFALKGIRFIDGWIANPAYGVLLVTGLIMVFLGHWSITALWIIIALVGFVAVALLGVVIYSPLLSNQIRLADAGDVTSPEAAALSRRGRVFGPLLGIIVLVILAMMVFKPAL
jgi:uncharacterized membrane protein